MRKVISQFYLKKADAINIICLFIFCTLFLSPYIFTSPTPLIFPVSELGGDLDREVLPNIEYVVSALKSTGQLPTWRPYLLSGAPIIGHPTFPVFYPLYWLFLIVPIPLWLNILALFNFFILGSGVYFYLRISGARSPMPALVGAVFAAISPKWVAHLSGGHWFMLAALAFSPWAIFAMDRYWKTRRVFWLMLLSVFLSIQVLNHQPIFTITSLSLALIAIFEISRQNWKTWFRVIPSGGLFVALLTFGLSAVTLLPLLELIPYSAQADTGSTFTSLNPAALIVILLPPDLKYPEWFLYPGLLVIVFTGIGWSYGLSKFEKKWAILGLIGIVLSLGEYTPIYSGLFSWNFLLPLVRVPTRWWLLTFLTLIVLASGGFSHWLENNYSLNKKARIFATVFFSLEIFAGIMKYFLGNSFPFNSIPSAFIAVLFALFLIIKHPKVTNLFTALMVIGLLCELILIGHSLIKPMDANGIGAGVKEAARIKSQLTPGERIYSHGNGFPPITLIRNGIYAVEGYDALPSARYLEFVRLATGCPLVHDPNSTEDDQIACLELNMPHPEWLQLLNARLLVLDQNGGWKIDSLTPGFGRAFSLPVVEQVNENECFDRLGSIHVKSIALIEEKPFANQNGTIEVLSRQSTPDGEIYQVVVHDFPALMIRSESWAPGWYTRVDGQKERVIRVDCVLQGVWLNPGNHIVEFNYQPFGYPIGKWISFGSLVAVILGLLISSLLKNVNVKS